jgi:hypothetical protein
MFRLSPVIETFVLDIYKLRHDTSVRALNSTSAWELSVLVQRC